VTYNLWKLDDHPELVSALFAAHREAAIVNDNASKIVVQQAWGGSGRFENAMIAGLATIGALHAPLTAARDLWERKASWPEDIATWDFTEERIPGFGNSFHKDVAGDPAFFALAALLHRRYRWADIRLDELMHLIWERFPGAKLVPNAAMYTAIVASICEVPRGLESALFALARIPAWAEMCGAVQHPIVGGVR
jgi:citrate synthase